MGISHMLEHMAFKGTASRSARAIAEEIEAVGGILNAYTSREQTAFHARVLKDDVPLALDIIADILTNPSFEPAELERERQVVLQELGQARDTPDDIIFDHLQIGDLSRTSRWAGRSWAKKRRSTLSRRADAAATTWPRTTAPERMTLVASGAVDHARRSCASRRKNSPA